MSLEIEEERSIHNNLPRSFYPFSFNSNLVESELSQMH